MNNPLTHRYQAIIHIQAATPLVVGTGEGDAFTDQSIAKDALGLPYIPGTSLTGVLRHSLQAFYDDWDDDTDECIFGIMKKEDKKGKKDENGKGETKTQGSRLIVSSAQLKTGDRVWDGLESVEDPLFDEVFLQIQDALVYRDHVRINHQGVVDDRGKFESELLPKGIEMVFELELLGTEADEANWQKLLQALYHPFFRIGGGTRKGFGSLKVQDIYQRKLDLKDAAQRQQYLAKSSLIEWYSKEKFSALGFSAVGKHEAENVKQRYLQYEICLEPKDFFLFDGQFDMEAMQNFTKELFKNNPEAKLPDFTPKREYIAEWDKDKNKYIFDYQYLIPATSIKGAIAHRVAYHYNAAVGASPNDAEQRLLAEVQALLSQDPSRLFEQDTAKASIEKAIADQDKNLISKIEHTNGFSESEVMTKINRYIEILSGESGGLSFEEITGSNNQAVKALFGHALDTSKKQGQRGRVLINDIHIPKDKVETKLFNHVKIDRFTGGAVDTALFTENVLALKHKEKIKIDISVDLSQFKNDEEKPYISALHKAFNDLTQGRLALGGGSMRGHGMMKGELKVTHKPTDYELPR